MAAAPKAKKVRITPLPRPVDTRKLDDEAHIRIHTVALETGLAPGTIRNLMSRVPPAFPMPVIRGGPGPNYWRLGDIRAWLKHKRGKG